MPFVHLTGSGSETSLVDELRRHHSIACYEFSCSLCWFSLLSEDSISESLIKFTTLWQSAEVITKPNINMNRITGSFIFLPPLDFS